MRNNFPKRPGGGGGADHRYILCQNLKMFPLVLYPLLPFNFKAGCCFICSRRRVTVARYRMIYLALVKSHFIYSLCRVEPVVQLPAKGLTKCYYSSIIARLSDIGLPSLFVATRQYLTLFVSGMLIFKHFNMCTLARRGTFPCTFGVYLQIKSRTAGTSPFHFFYSCL